MLFIDALAVRVYRVASQKFSLKYFRKHLNLRNKRHENLALHGYVYYVYINIQCIHLYNVYRFSNSHWRSVLTSLVVRDASVTTTHYVGGVLWRTSVLEGPSARMQQSQWDGCRTPVSAFQPQSPPTSLSWMTRRLWVCSMLALFERTTHLRTSLCYR